MALIVRITSNNPQGQQVMNALAQIREGVATLRKFDGLRLEAIGAGQATMADVFGVASNEQAQAISDRWGALLAAHDGDVPEWAQADPYALLRDMVNATTYQ
jgi:hypothetical protein